MSIEALEVQIREALLHQRQRTHDVADGHTAMRGTADEQVEIGIRFGIGTVGRRLVHDGFQERRADLRARHQGRHLLLFTGLPLDELLDIRMVDVQDDHLRCTTCRTTALDGAGCTVEDLEEGHEAGRNAATGEGLAFATKVGEVRARTRTELEDARLARHQVEDAAVVHQIVFHGLDEAGMGLRMRIGIGRLRELLRIGIDVIVALRTPGDAVGEVETRIEPLRRVRRRHLTQQHEGDLVVEDLGIFRRIEITVLLAPPAPAAGHAVHDLANGRFGTENGTALLVDNRITGDIYLRNTGLAEIFLRQDVRGNL